MQRGLLDVIVIGDGLRAAALSRSLALRGVSVALVTQEFAGASELGVMLFCDVTNQADRWLSRAEGARLAAVAPHLATAVAVGESAISCAEPGDAGQPRPSAFAIDVARLAQLFALDAKQRGARMHAHGTVERARRDEEGVYRVTMSGVTLSARSVVVSSTLGETRRLVSKLLPADAIPSWAVATMLAIDFDARVTEATVALDGPAIEVFPTALGARVLAIASVSDAATIRERALALSPALAGAPVLAVTAHETPEHDPEGALAVAASRDAPGCFVMAQLPLLAQVDEVCTRLRAYLDHASTRESELAPPLLGADPAAASASLAERYAVPELVVRRLVARQGSHAREVLERTSHRPEERASVCACELVLECEIRHAVARERAGSLAEVASRTRVGMGACGGMRCAHRAAQIVSEERGAPPDDAHREAAALVEQAYRARLPMLTMTDLAREQLLAARLVYGGAEIVSDAAVRVDGGGDASPDVHADERSDPGASA